MLRVCISFKVVKGKAEILNFIFKWGVYNSIHMMRNLTVILFQIPLERPSNFPQSYVESTHRREFFERFGNNMEEDHLQQLHERGAGGGGAVLLGDLEATALAGKDNTSPDVISLKVYWN